MKYTHIENVPTEKRETINQKILQLVNQASPCPQNTPHGQDRPPIPRQSITPDDVFACYTGLGKLHGLQRADYDNYHDYAEEKKIKELGQYFTPPDLCAQVVRLLEIGSTDVVGDLTCGSGNFINALPVEANAYGCEVEPGASRIARYLYPEAKISEQDVQYYQPGVYFDVVVGNPPFNFKFSYQGQAVSSQLFYCLKAAELLKPGGLLAVLVPESFLNDTFRCKSEIERLELQLDFVAQSLLPADSFAALGMMAVRTKLLILSKQSPNLERKPYRAECPALSWGALAEWIAPALQQRSESRSKLTLEFARYFEDGHQQESRIRKLLFEIKTHPAMQSCYPGAEALVRQLGEQRAPAGMTAKEWEESKLTPAKVIKDLQQIVRNQNTPERDTIRLVKTAYGFRWKGYSKATREKISSSQQAAYFSFTDLVANQGDAPGGPWLTPADARNLQRVVGKRRRAYHRQNQSWNEMKQDAFIKDYLENFRFLDKNNQPGRLTDIQREDLGLVLQKRYAQLNWEMGAGKTVAGYAWACFREQYNHCRTVFVCSAAIAIHMTWEPFLEQHRRPFVKVKGISDFENIQAGDFVLLTSEMTIRYQRQIKTYLRRTARKAALIFDESDQITNYQTKINQAMQSCFGRLPYKLNTTGTSTRNHINELYPQLRLLYNNSINMRCTAPRLFKEIQVKRKDVIHASLAGKQIKEEANEYEGLPFPASHGQELFKACFCPTRATVFGIEKENQDILQVEHLSPIIQKTILTRRFKEIAGDKYSIESHRIRQNPYEVGVYEKVMSEFSNMVSHYFNSTGDHKKDSMLRIIRQIQLLIKACSVPHTFREYEGGETKPAKFDYIASLVGQCTYKVLIGTTTKLGAREYQRFLAERFPFVPVYLITGSTSFAQRKKIVAEFEQHERAIIVANQQAMSSSVSIRTCPHVILESLQWNIPRMSQFYFRAIRFDSVHRVKVHFVTYQRSIEQNLLALLMSKERLNEYIKTLEVADRGDIFDSFDIDLSLLNSLISKQYDQEGKMYLSWGKQQIS